MAAPAPENRLLASLPPADLARLVARMADAALGHRDLLYLPGGPVEHVYFPRTGVLSATVEMRDGQSAEVAVIGREGMAGAAAALGASRSSEHVFCQVEPSLCRKMAAADFAAEVGRGGPLQKAVFGHLRAARAAAHRSAACSALHPNDERCARWVLACRDRVGADDFPLTHEFLAMMLGVRRATVTVTAGTLQSAGLIRYRHGRMTVLDAAGLEEAACECYQAIRAAHDSPP